MAGVAAAGRCTVVTGVRAVVRACRSRGMSAIGGRTLMCRMLVYGCSCRMGVVPCLGSMDRAGFMDLRAAVRCVGVRDLHRRGRTRHADWEDRQADRRHRNDESPEQVHRISAFAFQSSSHSHEDPLTASWSDTQILSLGRQAMPCARRPFGPSTISIAALHAGRLWAASKCNHGRLCPRHTFGARSPSSLAAKAYATFPCGKVKRRTRSDPNVVSGPRRALHGSGRLIKPIVERR